MGIPETFVASDLHGFSEEFTAALSRIELKKETRVILLGDYIDKGPEPYNLVQSVLALEDELRYKGGELITLLGNHDWWLKRWLLGRSVEIREERQKTLNDLTHAETIEKLGYRHLRNPHSQDFFDALRWSFEDELGNKYVHAYYSPHFVNQTIPQKKVKLVYGPVLSGERIDGLPNRDEWYKGYDGRYGRVYFGHYNLGKLNAGNPTHFSHATCVDCCVEETGILRFLHVNSGDTL